MPPQDTIGYIWKNKTKGKKIASMGYYLELLTSEVLKTSLLNYYRQLSLLMVDPPELNGRTLLPKTTTYLSHRN